MAKYKYVKLPINIFEVKQNVFMGLTGQQIKFCFIGLACGIIPFFIFKACFGMIAGIVALLISAFPAVFCGIYNDNGITFLQKVRLMRNFYRNPRKRIFQMKNAIDYIELNVEKKKLIKELKTMDNKKSKSPLSKEERKAMRKRIAYIDSVFSDKEQKRYVQNTVPYSQMSKDGIAVIPKTYFDNHSARYDFYSKTLKFGDINYQLASDDEQASIFEIYSEIINYFDDSISFQLTFENRKRDNDVLVKKIIIPNQEDGFDNLREEYSNMLKDKLVQGENGNETIKFLTFGIFSKSLGEARVKLNVIGAELQKLFKDGNIESKILGGTERLFVFYRALNPYSRNKFLFDWNLYKRLGADTKNAILPTSMNFNKKNFELGDCYGSVMSVKLMASEIKDRILFDFLDENELFCINIHVKAFDIITGQRKIEDALLNVQAIKSDKQDKIYQRGGDINNLPMGLQDTIDQLDEFVKDLKSKDEKLFEITLTVRAYAHTQKHMKLLCETVRRKWESNGCRLISCDWQQEDGLCASIPLGVTKVLNKRPMSTSSLAIFLPFTSRDLFQIDSPRCSYYGLNTLTHNMIFADKTLLKNPNSLVLGTPGCFTGDTKIQLADGSTASLKQLYKDCRDIEIRSYDTVTNRIVTATATDPRISGEVSELTVITLESGETVKCTPNHLILTANNEYVHAEELKSLDKLSGNHIVLKVELLKLDTTVNVYDITVKPYQNFILDNGLIVHNSGKSFSVKREISDVFLKLPDDILICDPEGEFFPLVRKLQGQIICLSTTSNDFINPMDIVFDPELIDEEDPIPDKVNFILSLMELIAGGKFGLSPEELGLIDRAAGKIYTNFLNNNPTADKMPILEDLYEELKQYGEKKGEPTERMCGALEMYVYGTQKIFNNRSNIDINNRIVCFDIKNLKGSIKKIGMLVVQEAVWNRVSLNRRAKKYTRYYVDEFHLLLKEPQTAQYSIEFWKRFRKYYGIPCGITQNVKDFLSSPEIESIFENTKFFYLLDQAPGDRDILMEKLQISHQQIKKVTEAKEGCGLIKYGDIILPFTDEFPNDTELYKLMTTKPSDL